MDHLFDTHFHLDLQIDRTSAIREIEEHQIYTISVTNLPDLYRKESIEIASRYIRFALGFHPELVHQYKNQIPLMWELLTSTRYIGEVGLDFVDTTFKIEQMNFFSNLIERCRYDSNKIISIHSRCAARQILEILGQNFKFIPILHWYTGEKKELFEAIDRGCFFSVNNAMMRSTKFRSLLLSIPNDRILLETDSPFILSKHTHSYTLKETAQLIKDMKHDMPLNLWDNFRKIIAPSKTISG